MKAVRANHLAEVSRGARFATASGPAVRLTLEIRYLRDYVGVAQDQS